MKFTKSQLKKLIKEELLAEAKYKSPFVDDSEALFAVDREESAKQFADAPDLTVLIRLRDATKDMIEASRSMAHRLYGEGAMKRRDDGHPSLTEPFLSTFDKQKVERSRKAVNASIELVKGALKDLEGIDLGGSP
jgi:hypothetical protein